MTTIAFVQARIGSTRFPNKILQKINKKTTIEILLKRLSRSKLVNQIVVVSPEEEKNSKGGPSYFEVTKLPNYIELRCIFFQLT